MTSCNGFRSWNAYNVDLWINNDEALYNLAMECLKSKRPVKTFFENVPCGSKTPDGAIYNIYSVRNSLSLLNS